MPEEQEEGSGFRVQGSGAGVSSSSSGSGFGVQGSGGDASPPPIAPTPPLLPHSWLLRKLRRSRTFFLLVVPVGCLFAAEPLPALYGVGVGFAAAGQALRLWAAGHIRKEQALAVDGPYALTRNPLYAGSLLITLGWAVMSGRVLPAAVLLLAYTATHWPTILDEEARLRELFGAEYEAYCGRVPRLLPLPRRVGERGNGGAGDVGSGRKGENRPPAASPALPFAHSPAQRAPGNFSWRQAIYYNREGKSAVGVALLTLAYGTRLWW